MHAYQRNMDLFTFLRAPQPTNTIESGSDDKLLFIYSNHFIKSIHIKQRHYLPLRRFRSYKLEPKKRYCPSMEPTVDMYPDDHIFAWTAWT